MKLLLTSSGITNDSIRRALVDMLGKPFAEAKVVCIPTAIYAMQGGVGYAWEVLREVDKLGWAELSVLELTALATLPETDWLPSIEAADAIFISGGNMGYLSYWMQESGFAEKLPKLLEKAVYIGVSAGSMVISHSLHVDRERLEKTGIYYDDEYDEAAPPKASSYQTLKLVDFVLRPHLNSEDFPRITLENMERSAAKLAVPMYAFDDQTAVAVTDGDVQVISEGEWKRFG